MLSVIAIVAIILLICRPFGRYRHFYGGGWLFGPHHFHHPPMGGPRGPMGPGGFGGFGGPRGPMGPGGFGGPGGPGGPGGFGGHH